VGADVVGVDIDRAAATCARRNGVPAIVGDLAEPIGGRRDFDLVTAVAPYVPTAEISYLPADVQRYEPRVALDGGADGLAIVRRVIAAAARLLRVGGWLFTELGGEQDATVSRLLGGSGFGSPTRWFDEDDDLRGIGTQFLG
jgi:release factor glutamine methyltransferase